MKQTVIHPKGWTEEDEKLVAEYVAEVKAERAVEAKENWRKQKEIEAGLLIQNNYYRGMNSPRDVPQMRKQAGWLEEQNRTAKPIGYYDSERAKEKIFIFLTAPVVAVLLFLLAWKITSN